MTQLTGIDFLEFMDRWITNNLEKISTMWPQKGGWEEWAKTDLYSMIIGTDSTYDILREQPVFLNNREQADFLLNHTYLLNERVVIEMKCQSFENYKNFKRGLEEDIQKMGRLKEEYRQATQIVLGIYFTEHRNEIPNYFYTKIYGDGEIGLCWAVNEGN